MDFLVVTGGRSGVCWPTFESDHNHAPQKPHPGLMSYNAITGLMSVSGKSYTLQMCVPSNQYRSMNERVLLSSFPETVLLLILITVNEIAIV